MASNVQELDETESQVANQPNLQSSEVAATFQNALQVRQSAGQSLDQSLAQALTSIAGLSPQDGVRVAPSVIINNRQGDIIHAANLISGASKFTVDQSGLTSVGNSEDKTKKEKEKLSNKRARKSSKSGLIGLGNGNYNKKKKVGKPPNNRHGETSKIFPEPKDVTEISAVINRLINGIIVNIEDDSMSSNTYRVHVYPLSSIGGDEIIRESNQCSVPIRGLTPGEEYRVSVLTRTTEDCSKEIFMKGTIQMLPAEVPTPIPTHDCETNKITFKWDTPEIEPDYYIVECKIGNQLLPKEEVHHPLFEVHDVKPAHKYSIRVFSVNSAGPGRASQWLSFVSDPPPPENIKVFSNFLSQPRSLIVKYDSVDLPNVKYRVEAISRRNGDIVMTEVTDKNTVALEGLASSILFTISVVTLYQDKESKKGYFGRYKYRA